MSTLRHTSLAARRTSLAVILTAVLVSAPVWAGQLSLDGVPNFYKVDEHVYRGAQPLPQGWAELAKLGVKTVIDLRHPGEHSTTDEARIVEAAGMRYVNVPMRGFSAPTSETITKALDAIDAGEPVFIHCKLGKDRTGTIVAAYRIRNAGWANDKALAEARDCGIHWYSAQMKTWIKGYRPSQPALAAQVVADSVVTGGAAPATATAEPRTEPGGANP